MHFRSVVTTPRTGCTYTRIPRGRSFGRGAKADTCSRVFSPLRCSLVCHFLPFASVSSRRRNQETEFRYGRIFCQTYNWCTTN
uniref:Protein translocation complex, SEC61 gamma subunit, putative n=1 Tax=Neospora caninum (strain Liverpool) TaxID=572307 RepID=A0A0F7UF57_NEOCL|nr:TPA: protein translocation complex, SEC61 gamma subunit, putative [Neospora caninum Liverpool]